MICLLSLYINNLKLEYIYISSLSKKPKRCNAVGKLLVAFVILVLLAVTIIFSQFSSWTGYTAADTSISTPKVAINLSKTAYSQDESLEGIISINFTSPYYSDAQFKVTLDSEEDKLSIKELLSDQEIPFNETPGGQQVINPTAIKILTFQQASSQQVALKVPKSSTIRIFSLMIEGDKLDSVYPQQPYLDIGTDSTKEWKYLGNLSNFSSPIYPEGFSSASESTAIMKDDGKFYCEIINLPAAKDFQVQSKYQYYDSSSTGNILAYLFSFSGSGTTITASGGANQCDLPEPSGLSVYSCNISLSSEISGKYLACVTNSNRPNQQKNSYTLMTDQASSSTSYTCPYFTSSGTCSRVSSSHFNIAVKPGNYQGSLSKKISLQDGKTQYDALQALKKAVADCIPVSNICTISLQAGTSSKGKLYLSELLISYTSEGLDKEEKNFYDTAVRRPVINAVNGKDLARTSSSIAVDLDDISVDLPSSPGSNFTLKVFLDNQLVSSASLKIEKKFSVNSTLSRIDRIKTEITSLNLGLLTQLGISANSNSALASLSSIRSKVLNVENSSNTTAQKEKSLEQLKKEIDLAIKDIPKEINIAKEVTDTIITSPNDIQGFEDDSSLATAQRAYKVKGTAKVYNVKYYSGNSESYTIIEKQITGNLASASLAEKLPAGISSDEVAFSTSVQEQDDYVLLLASSSFNYVLQGDASQYLQLFKTIVLVPRQVTEQISSVNVECGDNKCTSLEVNGELIPLEDSLTCPIDCKRKVPYTIIIIVAIALILGIYFINFYRGPGAPFPHAGKSKPEQLFRTKLDEVNLVNYIRSTQEKKIDRSKVDSILLAKGWTRKQVDYAYNEASKIRK